jgi:hypothetical protein
MSKYLRSHKKKRVELKFTPIQQRLLDNTKKLIKENPELGPLDTWGEQTFSTEDQRRFHNTRTVRLALDAIRDNVDSAFANLTDRNLTPQAIAVLEQETYRSLSSLQARGIIKDFQHDLNVTVDPNNPSVINIGFQIEPSMPLESITATISISNEDNYE